MKRLIARRGRPSKVYSDNGKTFVAAAKWLKKVSKDEKLCEFLSDESITWQFNLSRAPWWGGQFERLIGLMKAAFYKTVGQGLLSWEELSEVILDIEVTMNNRPLCYLKEDVQLPTLTPNSLLFVNSNILPELEPYHIEERGQRKRAKFLQVTKDAMWCRWTSEYLRALRERHRLKQGNKSSPLTVGDIVIVKSWERIRNRWPLGCVETLIVGKDDVVRGAKLRTGKLHIERLVQHLYPLELSCDRAADPRDVVGLNPGAPVFRPRRDAAVAANLREVRRGEERRGERGEERRGEERRGEERREERRGEERRGEERRGRRGEERRGEEEGEERRGERGEEREERRGERRRGEERRGEERREERRGEERRGEERGEERRGEERGGEERRGEERRGGGEERRGEERRGEGRGRLMSNIHIQLLLL
ncbi:hypothetical protein QZH41_006377 [Actinostola sp. cb2023]|nr:hypothetical protein QZH41_006377 [Actinostola sp. cb2023]